MKDYLDCIHILLNFFYRLDRNNLKVSDCHIIAKILTLPTGLLLIE